MARAYDSEVAEREYSFSSAQLQLADAKRHNKVLQFQRNALRDDLQRARGESTILAAQLKEEQDSCDMLKLELATLQRALINSARALSQADAKLIQLMVTTKSSRHVADAAVVEQDVIISKRLAKAEAGLAAATRREASLEQLLTSERVARRKLEAHPAFEIMSKIDSSRTFGHLSEERRSSLQQNEEIMNRNKQHSGDLGGIIMKDNVHENLQPDLHQSRRIQDLETGTGKTTFDSDPQVTANRTVQGREVSIARGINFIKMETRDTRDCMKNLHVDLRPSGPAEITEINSQLPPARNTKAGGVNSDRARTNEVSKPPKKIERGTSGLYEEAELTTVTVLNVIDDLSSRGYVSPVNNSFARNIGVEPQQGSCDGAPDNHRNVALSLGTQLDSANVKVKVPPVSDVTDYRTTAFLDLPLHNVQEMQTGEMTRHRSGQGKKKRKLLGQRALASSETLPQSMVRGVELGFEG